MLQRTSHRPLRLLSSLPRTSTISRRHASAEATVTDNPQPANTPTPRKLETEVSPVSPTNTLPSSSTGAHGRALVEPPEEAEERRVMQAPNRKGIWSRSQQSREKAMVGPRFEQIIMRDQPRPLAAIELIHQQPVRWVNDRKASCDGGGGPLGHPRIFINVDKPQICFCTYCGIPFAHEHHRKTLEAIPEGERSYPLEPSNQPSQLPRYDPGEARTGATETFQTTTGRPYEQR